MRRMLLLGVTLVAALWAVEPQLAAQKQGQLFIKLVGADGMPVTDLQASDVKVTEDGVERTTLKLEPIDWPIKLQVLVDNGKLNTNPINPLREGLKALFDQIPDGVETSLYTTSPQPRPNTGFTPCRTVNAPGWSTDRGRRRRSRSRFGTCRARISGRFSPGSRPRSASVR